MSTVSPKIRERLDQIADLPDLLPKDQWRSHRVTEVTAGSVVRVNDVPFRVLTKHRCETSGYEWFTTTCLSLTNGQTGYLGWDEIEGLHITFGDPEMTLENIGYSADWLRSVENKGSGQITCAGRTYYYKESCPANFHKDCGEKGEKYYYWLFESGDYGLSVEKFGNKYSVYLYRKIPASAVEILSAG